MYISELVKMILSASKRKDEHGYKEILTLKRQFKNLIDTTYHHEKELYIQQQEIKLHYYKSALNLLLKYHVQDISYIDEKMQDICMLQQEISDLKAEHKKNAENHGQLLVAIQERICHLRAIMGN